MTNPDPATVPEAERVLKNGERLRDVLAYRYDRVVLTELLALLSSSQEEIARQRLELCALTELATINIDLSPSEANGIVESIAEKLLRPTQAFIANLRQSQAEQLATKDAEIATLQAENVRLTAERDALCVRVENLKFDMNLVGAQLGISTREEIEPTVRKLLTDLTGEIERHAHAIDRAEAAESALAEAARRINCAGPVAHRIDVLRQEHEAQLRAARAQALEDAADLLNSAFWDIGGDDSAAEWLRARAASERKEGQ